MLKIYFKGVGVCWHVQRLQSSCVYTSFVGGSRLSVTRECRILYSKQSGKQGQGVRSGGELPAQLWLSHRNSSAARVAVESFVTRLMCCAYDRMCYIQLRIHQTSAGVSSLLTGIA